jgi:hypothetical protein
MPVALLSLPDLRPRTLVQVFAGESSGGLRIAVVDDQGSSRAHIELDSLAVAALREHGDRFELQEDLNRSGANLQEADQLAECIRAQLNWFVNTYEHDGCGTTWEDSHSCASDDDCPDCGHAISPTKSDEQRELVETEHAGVYTFVDHAAAKETSKHSGVPRERG